MADESVGGIAELYLGNILYALELAALSLDSQQKREEAAFYRADFIPRARALVNRLAETGFPPDKDDDYRAAFNRALAALQDLEDDTAQYIDDRHRGIDPEEDLLTQVWADGGSAWRN